MKKLFVIICVLVASYVSAQDVNYGVKAGLNLANNIGSDAENTDFNIRYYVGGFLNVPLLDGLLFQPEFIYSMQGVKVEDRSVDEESTFNTSYLNIPLLLKLSMDSYNKVAIYAGPQLGFLLESEVEQGSGDNKSTVDLKDETHSVDFSMNLGLSFNINENFALDVRYNRGFTKIMDGGDKAYNSVFQLGAAYTF